MFAPGCASKPSRSWRGARRSQAPDTRSIHELIGIIDSQRMDIDHTITVCEQSRRHQLLLQEEMSEQNRALRETCIRNMRDMDELQKSHVFKFEELSRRKLTEDPEEVTSFFQGLECRGSLQLWRQRREGTQMLRLTTCTPGNRWLHHCTFRSEKQVRACCRPSLTTRKACFNLDSQFSASMEKPVTGCHKKRKSNQE